MPPGVKFKIAYDRSNLINETIDTLQESVLEEVITVSLVVLLFMFHFGSSFVSILNILISILIGFILMKLFGVTSNIMSLGGIALAVGDLVDSSIVMTENAYRQLADRILKK